MKLRKLARRQMAQARGCHKTYPRGLQVPGWFSAKPWWMRRQLTGTLLVPVFSKELIEALYDWTVNAGMGSRPYMQGRFNQQTGETGDG